MASNGLRRFLPSLAALVFVLQQASGAAAADFIGRYGDSDPTVGGAPPDEGLGDGPSGFIDRLAGWNVVLGAGVLVAPKFEGSDELEVLPVPLVSATFGERVTLDARGLFVDLYAVDGFSFGAHVGYDLGRQEDDADHLRGLGDIGAGAVFGLTLAYQLEPVKAYLSVDRIVGGSDGLLGTLGVEVSHRQDRFLFSAGASTTWADEDYMEAYFGVTPAQSAASGLARYDADAGFKRIDLEASVTYRAWDHWLVRGQVGVGFLVGDAADSPVVQRGFQPSAMLLIGYSF